MHLIPIGWASTEHLIVDDFSQNPMAATIKIVKKRTTRFKCVHNPRISLSINLVPGATNPTATTASRRAGGNQRVSITGSAGGSRARLLCPRFVML